MARPKSRMTWNAEPAKAEMARETDRRLVRAGLLVEREVKKLIKVSQPSGRIYRRSSTRRHHASAPGEPPAIDRGHLLRSVTHMIKRGASRTAAVLIGARARYARSLEEGTDSLAPRPFLRPALRKAKPQLKRIFGIR